MSFRKSFVVAKNIFVQSFPNHMAKGLLVLQHRSPHIDGVFLVHDARIPLSGYSDNVFNCLQGMPLLLVLNKADLVPKQHLELAIKILEKRIPDVPILTSVVGKQHKGSDKFAKSILPTMLEIINMEDVIKKREENGEDFYIRLVVAGIPNCGKSSVINAMRRIYSKKGAGTRVGKMPGITRAVLNEINVCRDPPIFLVDTPGILDPSIPNSEVGLKLALVGTIAPSRVDDRLLCDFLLFNLNKHKMFEYVKFFKLDKPTDDINTLLSAVCKRIGALLPGARPNFNLAREYFLRRYREDRLGRFIMDLEPEVVDEFSKKKLAERLAVAKARDLKLVEHETWWKSTGLSSLPNADQDCVPRPVTPDIATPTPGVEVQSDQSGVPLETNLDSVGTPV